MWLTIILIVIAIYLFNKAINQVSDIQKSIHEDQ